MGFLATEFIGESIIVKNAHNKDLEGIKGMILDETRESFLINTDDGRKTILKQDATFTINGHSVDGNDIRKRPEDRLKL